MVVRAFLSVRPQLKCHTLRGLPRPPYLKCLSPNPHTFSHGPVLFSSTYHFPKLSYLRTGSFTNCLLLNFNEGRGLVSPGFTAVSPVHRAHCSINI